MEQDVRPRWRDRWRAGLFHVLATAAATAALGMVGGLAVVGVMVLGGANGGTTDSGAAAARLLGIVPVMVITGTGLGLVAGVLSAPWGIRRPADWTRPVIAASIGVFHLAGRLERSRVGEQPVGVVEVATSLTLALALWTAIALAAVLGGHRGAATGPPVGRAWRETVGAAALFMATVTFLAVRA